MRPLALLVLIVLAARATETSLPPCLGPALHGFCVVREYVVLDALTAVPAAVAGRDQLTMAEYQQALGAEKPPIAISGDMTDAQLVRLDAQRWIVLTMNRTFVRRSAVTGVDDRPGMLHALPPTPAVPGGANVLAQPISRGVTLIAGTGRVFCGVRSQARSLAIVSHDLDVLAQRVQAPTAELVVAELAEGE